MQTNLQTKDYWVIYCYNDFKNLRVKPLEALAAVLDNKRLWKTWGEQINKKTFYFFLNESFVTNERTCKIR